MKPEIIFCFGILGTIYNNILVHLGNLFFYGMNLRDFVAQKFKNSLAIYYELCKRTFGHRKLSYNIVSVHAEYYF